MSTYLIAADPKGYTTDYWHNESKNSTQQSLLKCTTLFQSVFSQSEVWNLYETLGYFLKLFFFLKALAALVALIQS